MSGDETGSTDGPGPGEREEHGARNPSRREFLRAGGIAAAGAVVGVAVGAAIAVAGPGAVPAPTTTPSPTAGAGPLDHLVVLMGENRSFDNLIGRLHPRRAAAGRRVRRARLRPLREHRARWHRHP